MSALSMPHLSGTVVTIAAIAAGLVLLALVFMFVRSRVSTPARPRTHASGGRRS